MEQETQFRCTAFEGTRRIASGSLVDVAVATKAVLERGEQAPVLVFDDTTGSVVELDLRGSLADVRARVEATTRTATEPQRGPGRPRLGVVSKEVTLLPRHWAWLGAQRGGASVTLRRLVDQARKAGEVHDRVRQSQDAAFRFMSAMAGDLPGFEEAIRGLFAGSQDKFDTETEAWPADVRAYGRALAADALRGPSPAT